MEARRTWRAPAVATALLAVTACVGDIRPTVEAPIEGFEPGIVLEAEGDLEGRLTVSDELAVLLRTPEEWINPGWVLEGIHADDSAWSGAVLSVGRGEAGVGGWDLIQPEPGEQWEDEEGDNISNLDLGTAWFVLNYSGEQGDMSLLSVSGEFEVVETTRDWAAGYINVSLIEQDPDTGEIVENAKEASLEGTFNIRLSTMGQI